MGILRDLRKKRHLSQEDVAEMLCVTTNTISNWERKSIIKKSDLHDLLDLYKVEYPECCEIVLAIYGKPECRMEDCRIKEAMSDVT